MNPCPCGFATDPDRECRCTPQQIDRYCGRLSGPLRDRLDLTVEVPALPPASLAEPTTGESSASVRARVSAARERQCVRYRSPGIRTNADLTPALIATNCRLDADAIRLLETAVQKLRLSARGYDRVRKVARTIADLAGRDHVVAEDLAEALQFRMTI
jgi:magnesium chelatase family protein